MNTGRISDRPHHRHLELARTQVGDLLSRQAVERDLVQRSTQHNRDLLANLVERQHRAALEQRLVSMHPADIAFVLEGLAPDARASAWRLVRRERRGAVLLESSDGTRRSLLEDMPARELASLLNPLESKDIAELVSTLPEHTKQEVLRELDTADQAQVRSVLAFPAGSVGAAMTFDIARVPADASLGAVQELLRKRGSLPPHSTHLFVVDERNRPCGLLSLTVLLLGDPDTYVADQMTRDLVFFHTDDPMGDAVSAFEKYDLVAAPVVNLQEQLVGRLTVDAVVDEINERAKVDGLRQVGLSREDEDLYVPIASAARRRWPWLALNLLTAVVASRVISVFQTTIADLAVLAALMPIVASIGGNAGNQSVALTLQGLSHDAGPPQGARRLVLREFAIGALNGALWGSLLGVLALLVYRDGPLALVLGVALWINLMLAGLTGVLAPLLLVRAGKNPVMGSGIILTATTDSLGFLIFLTLASCFLRG